MKVLYGTRGAIPAKLGLLVAGVTLRYPTPGLVCRNRGRAESFSDLRLSCATYPQIVRLFHLIRTLHFIQ